jgi:hypothetical protein
VLPEWYRLIAGAFEYLLACAVAATGFEIADVTFDRRLYGAYTCVKR